MTRAESARFRHSIRFVLDGRVVELQDVDPNRTVLQFLREDLNRTGTKEGCAEGDCGACTVVIAEIDAQGTRLAARAVNACIQFLPTLDGKELITVESLAGDELHPAQQAMIEQHGSQCGFCTPGFVMSLFALYKNNPRPGRRDIDDALAGNLCRCTGYQPIVDAALAMYRNPAAGDDWTRQVAGGPAGADEEVRIDRLRELAPAGPLCLEHGQHRFFAPRTLGELAALVEQYPQAALLAGGTDLALRVTKALDDLGTLILVANVAELRVLATTDTHLEVGAAVTLSEALPVFQLHFPGLGELFLRFASPPVRNAATIGGNVANASPIGDSMPALLALDAELVLRQGRATRKLPLERFYTGYRETALRAGEFIERILVPLTGADEQVRSYKVSKRFDQDISAVCGAYRLRLKGGRVDEIRVAYGGMAATPKRALHCERALAGQDWTEATIRSALAALDEDFAPISDMRASGNYRRQVCRNLLLRFYLESCGREIRRVYDYGR